MQLSKVFDRLRYGEAKQLNFGSFEDPNEFDVSKYPELITHLNTALSALYVRFTLKEAEHIIECVDHQTLYPLPVDNANVISVFLGGGGELPINNENRENSVYLSGYSDIQVPFAADEVFVHVMYRQLPAELVCPADPSTLDMSQEVPLPSTMLTALVSYTEYQMCMAKGGEAGQAAAANALQRYQLACLEVEEQNLLRGISDDVDARFLKGGWT